MQCPVLHTLLHGSDLTPACHPGHPGQAEQNPATQRKLPNHMKPAPPRGLRALIGPPQCHCKLSSMNRSISGCLQESEMHGQDDVRGVENTGEQKSFCLQSSCEFKIQNTYPSNSPADCNPCHSFKSGQSKLFQQAQPCELALRTAFGNESMATHFWSKEEKAQVAQPSAHECSTAEAQKHLEFTIWALQSTTVAVSVEAMCSQILKSHTVIKMNRNIRTRTDVLNNLMRVKL